MSRTLAAIDCATREVTFDPQLHRGCGYRMEVGDWVMVGVVSVRGEEGEGEGEEEGEGEVVEYVRPLREREVEGQVTSVSHSSGFIDDEIIFSARVCGRSQVRVGECVLVRCVECRHYQASWRAVSVTTVSSHPHTLPPSPLSPSLPLVTAQKQ